MTSRFGVVALDVPSPRVAVSESDHGMSVPVQVTKEVGEAVIRIVDLNNGEADK